MLDIYISARGIMAYQLIVHAPDGDIIIGSYPTKSAAEKLAAIAIPVWERWSVIEIDGEARPAAVIDLAVYKAKRNHRPGKE